MLRLTHPYPPLTDGVLWLRVPMPSDAEAVCRACQDPEIKRWNAIPDPYHVEHAREFIAQTLESTRAGQTMNTFGFDHEGVLVGSFGVPAFDRGNRTAEIGYWVAAEVRGRGFAGRAVVLLREWLASAQGVRTVEMLIDRDNAGSRRVAEKTGFTDTGERRPRPRPKPGEEVSMERTHIVYAWPAP